MRLLFVISAAILASGAGAEGPSQPVRDMPVLNPNVPFSKGCPPTSRFEAARRGGPMGAQKLNELPAADMYAAVYRRVGGCVAPIITGFGIGGR